MNVSKEMNINDTVIEQWSNNGNDNGIMKDELSRSALDEE